MPVSENKLLKKVCFSSKKSLFQEEIIVQRQNQKKAQSKTYKMNNPKLRRSSLTQLLDYF